MASLRFHFLFIVMICVNTWPHGFALRLEISPSQILESVTRQVNITCTADGSLKEIIVLEVSKDGGDALAIQKLNSATEIGPGLKTNARADGRLTRIPNGSFLTITLDNPGQDELGMYTCLVYYMSIHGDLAKDTVSANLTTENDFRSVIAYLAEKLNIQENQIENQKQKVNHLEQMINGQENDSKLCQEQSDKIVVLEDTVRKLESLISMQNTSLTDQKEKLKTVESTLRDQHSEIQEQKMFSNSLNYTLGRIEITQGIQQGQINDQMRQKQDLRDYAAGAIAFHAGYDSNSNSLTIGEIAVFSYVELNEGGGYNTTTGEFMAPVPGLYVFNLVGTTVNPSNDLYIDLVANHVTMGRSYIIDKSFGDQSGVSCVTRLQTGDIVKPVVTTMHDRSAMESFPYSWFSGYLLHNL